MCWWLFLAERIETDDFSRRSRFLRLCVFAFRICIAESGALLGGRFVRFRLEVQAELNARIDKGRKRAKRNCKRCGNLAEGQRHFEMMFFHLQSPELILADDRHLFGVLFEEKIGNLHAGEMRSERQAEMM